MAEILIDALSSTPIEVSLDSVEFEISLDATPILESSIVTRLEKAIAEANAYTDTKANANDVYTREETNNLINQVLNGDGTNPGVTTPITVDSVLDVNSTNAIQNRAVKQALDTKANAADVYAKTDVDNKISSAVNPVVERVTLLENSPSVPTDLVDKVDANAQAIAEANSNLTDLNDDLDALDGRVKTLEDNPADNTYDDTDIKNSISSLVDFDNKVSDAINDISETTRNLLSFNTIDIYEASDYIPIDIIKSGEYIVTADNVTSTDTDSSITRIYYFDNEKKSVGYTNFRRGTNVVNTVNTVLSNDAYFVRFYASSSAANSKGDSASFVNVMVRDVDENNSEFIPHKSAIDEIARHEVFNQQSSLYSMSKMYRVLKSQESFINMNINGMDYYNGYFYICGNENNGESFLMKTSSLNGFEVSSISRYANGHRNDCVIVNGIVYICNTDTTITLFNAETMEFIENITTDISVSSISYCDGYFYFRQGYNIFKYALVEHNFVLDSLFYRLKTAPSVFQKYGYDHITGQSMTIINGKIYALYTVYNTTSEINKAFIVILNGESEDTLLLDIFNGDEVEGICYVDEKIYISTISTNFLGVNEYTRGYNGSLMYNALIANSDINNTLGIGVWAGKRTDSITNVPVSNVDFLLTNKQTPFGILQIFECYQNGYICKKRVVSNSITEWAD